MSGIPLDVYRMTTFSVSFHPDDHDLAGGLNEHRVLNFLRRVRQTVVIALSVGAKRRVQLAVRVKAGNK